MASKLCTFSGPEGQLLDSYSVSGEALWTKNSATVGSAAISSGGRLRPNSVNTTCLYYVNNFSPATANYSVACNIHYFNTSTNSAGLRAGLCLRYGVSAATGYLVLLESQKSTSTRIALYNGSVGTAIATYDSGVLATATKYALKAMISGGNNPTIKVYFNASNSAGTVVITHTPVSIVTDVGVAGVFLQGIDGFVGDRTGWHLDNFQVSDNILDISNDEHVFFPVRNNTMNAGSYTKIQSSFIKNVYRQDATNVLHGACNRLSDFKYYGK